MTTIRVIGKDEAERFKALRLKGLEESPEAFDSTAKIEGPLSLGDWKKWLTAGQDRQVFVAEKDRELLGTVTVAPVLNQPELLSVFALWVAPEVRRQKVGTELMNKALAFARTTGRKRVRVHVGEPNAAAIAFFESLGFEDTGVRLTYRADLGFDGWVLERPIEASA